MQTLGGIGDAILGLTAVCGLSDRHPDQRIIYSCPRHAWPWVALFGGRYELSEEASFPAIRYELAPAYHDEKRARGGGMTRAQRYASLCGEVSAHNPSPKPLPPSAYPGHVVLCPSTAQWPRREWLLPNWLALEQMLLDCGLAVVVLTHAPESLPQMRSPKVRGTSVEVASILNEARVVVGGDTGLLHLCGALGAPGLVLAGPTLGALVYGNWPTIQAIEGQLPCRGCYEQGLGRVCESVCAALNQISPASVFAAVRAMPQRMEGCVPLLGAVAADRQRHDPYGGDLQPWFTPGALDEIQEWDLHDKVVLEWGGGASTFWWARRCARVFTIEADPGWARWLRNHADREGFDNISVSHRPARETPNEFTRLPDGCRPDIVVIDGARRLECLKAALALPRPLTIIFDNWQQSGAFISAEAEALMREYHGRSFPEISGRSARHPWQTAIWRMPDPILDPLPT